MTEATNPLGHTPFTTSRTKAQMLAYIEKFFDDDELFYPMFITRSWLNEELCLEESDLSDKPLTAEQFEETCEIIESDNWLWDVVNTTTAQHAKYVLGQN
jgi:hypothetical protein